MAAKKRKAKAPAKRAKKATRGTGRAKAPARRAKKTPAKRTAPASGRGKSAPRAPATEAATVKVHVFDAGATQQLSFAEVLGDIEERMALDTLREDE